MTLFKYPGKKLLFFLSVVLFLGTSCQKQPNLLFGNSYTNDNNGANIVVVDTSTVLLSTVYTDSTSTNGTGYLMVGSYNDPYLGNITSRAYWQVAPPSIGACTGKSTRPRNQEAMNPQSEPVTSMGISVW